MGVMKRLSNIVQAKANKALDKVEDPRETLDLSYEQQLESLQKLKRAVADIATSKKRVELQAQQLQQTAQKLQDQAKQALQQNREDLAKEALARRASIAAQLQDLQTQHDQLDAQEQKLVAQTQRIQAQVESFRTKKETLKANYTAAEAQTKAQEAITGISEQMGDVGMALQRAQDKIDQMQARAGALDDLIDSGALEDMTGSSDPLQRELDKTAQQSQVDAELAQLKAEVSAGTQTQAITASSQSSGNDSAETEGAQSDS